MTSFFSSIDYPFASESRHFDDVHPSSKYQNESVLDLKEDVAMTEVVAL